MSTRTDSIDTLYMYIPFINRLWHLKTQKNMKQVPDTKAPNNNELSAKNKVSFMYIELSGITTQSLSSYVQHHMASQDSSPDKEHKEANVPPSSPTHPEQSSSTEVHASTTPPDVRCFL